jgi:ribosomal protein S27E
MDNGSEFLRKLITTPFKFWCCSNVKHKQVTWNSQGTQATCDECGEKSRTIEG